jgi:hypothetical protein
VSEITSERRWRKKPVEIEAVQWTGKNRNEIREFAGNQVQFGGKPDALGRTLYIFTLEGRLSAPDGAWIIKGIKGEFYACDEQVFAASYEPAAAYLAQHTRAEAAEARVKVLEEALRDAQGNLQAAEKSSDLSSALTKQYFLRALDDVTAALAAQTGGGS